MAIKKQEFYEGAALHLLARGGGVTGIRYEQPLFVINNEVLVLLKYSTKGRSPWGFTFMPEERNILQRQPVNTPIIIGMICGSDGVAAMTFDEYLSIAGASATAVHVACYRLHGEFYEISGPGGILSKKVPPSRWSRSLDLGRD